MHGGGGGSERPLWESAAPGGSIGLQYIPPLSPDVHGTLELSLSIPNKANRRVRVREEVSGFVWMIGTTDKKGKAYTRFVEREQPPNRLIRDRLVVEFLDSGDPKVNESSHAT
jgi:hypothetical protein